MTFQQPKNLRTQCHRLIPLWGYINFPKGQVKLAWFGLWIATVIPLRFATGNKVDKAVII
jgi:hypothetical protein